MPTIDIPDRICPHCGGIRWIIEKTKRPSLINPNYIRVRYRCSKKSNERYNNWKITNPEKVKEYEKKRKKKDWKTPKYREYGRKREAKQRAELTDKYIKYTLRHNPIHRNATITPEMIERQRQYLKVKRHLKNLENEKDTTKRKQTKTDRRRILSNGRKSKKGL